MKENNIYLTFIGIVAIVAIVGITLGISNYGKPGTASRVDALTAQQARQAPQEPLVGQAYVAQLSTSAPIKQPLSSEYPITEVQKKTAVAWKNSPAADKMGKEENPRACLDLDTLKDNNGYVVLRTEHQVYTDDKGRPAIAICPYQFYVTQINISDDELNVYCIDNGSINGPGIYSWTLGFNGKGKFSHVRNCIIDDFNFGIYNLRGKITDNTIQNNYWGITDSSNAIIKDNIIMAINTPDSYGIVNTYMGYISGNTIKVQSYGIRTSGAGTIEDNVIYGCQIGMDIYSGGYIMNNYVSADNTGIHLEPHYQDEWFITGNDIGAGSRGIDVKYTPSMFFSGILNIGRNTITPTRDGSPKAIVVDGGNMGVTPYLKISDNTIIDAFNGIYLKNDIQDAIVADNNIIASNYALACGRGQGITWTCNDCNNGAVFNDQCNPQAFCEVCGGGPGTPGPGGSPIMAKMPYEMRPR